MKKLLTSLCVVGMLLGIGSAAAAYQFEDKIDTWNVLGFEVDAVPIWQLAGPLEYTHDLNDDVNFAAGHTVTEAWLELDFTNDETDDHGSTCWGLIKWDFREFVTVGFDGTEWQEIGEVDNGQYQLVVDIDWINDDGFLDVSLDVWNPLGTITQTAYLDHSRVYGNAVPEPTTVLLLGVGILGLVGLKRKHRAKR